MFKKPSLFVVFIITLAAHQAVLAVSDPTRPPGYGERHAKKISFQLDSVLVSETRKVAIVNGQSVVEGDRIGDAKVISISKQKVRLNKGGNVIELKPKRVSVRREK